MLTSPHRIRRLRWQVRCASPPEAFAWRRRLHDEGEEFLLPLLTRAFDAAVAGDRVVYLPRLELTLHLPPDQPLASLAASLYEQLAAKLGDLLAFPATSSELAPGPREVAVPQDRLAVLRHYLTTGLLPWRATGEPGWAGPETLAAAGREFWPQVKEHLLRSPAGPEGYFRLLQLYPAADLPELLRGLTASLPSSDQEVAYQFFTRLWTPAALALPRHLRLRFTAALLAGSLGLPASHPGPVAAAALSAVPPGQLPAWQAFIASLPGTVTAWLTRLGFTGLHPTAATPPPLRDPAPPPAAMSGVPPGAPGLPGEVPPEPPGWLPEPPPPAAGRSPAPPDAAVIADLYPLRVEHAGLVLLHPFLPQLLSAAGLLSAGDEHLSPSVQGRAAALLHFLATGRDEPYEYELGLIKVLVGLEPLHPLLVSGGLLRPGDREEAGTLLISVIQHWQALKDTSVAGLRTSFLQRPALLRASEDGWQLTVEPRPYDMLLDLLPWGISIIKLPWLRQGIFTTWTLP